MRDAEEMDADDELAAFRNEFFLPEGVIYLDGNSLGLLSSPAEKSVLRVLDEWKRLGVGGWTEADPPWFFLAEELAKITAELIGAEPEETIVTNSTTVNLHQLLATLVTASNPTDISAEDARNTILTDGFIFPSDAYAIDSFIKLLNSSVGTRRYRRITAAIRDEYLLDETDIIAAMTPDVLLAVLPSAVYTTGQVLDMERLTHAAHDRGLLIGFDCSHSIGCVPHALSKWGVDFAFWCGYKYLNGGPGASGGLYLNRRHFGVAPGLAGWFSSRKECQLAMSATPIFAENAGAMQIGTPNVLSMAPLCGALTTIRTAGIERIRAKSLALNNYLVHLAQSYLSEFSFRFIGPTEAHRRGGHTALAHPDAIRICKALRARGIVPDYRPPDIVRLAPIALYTSFAECRQAIAILREIMTTESYTAYPIERPLIP